MLTRFSMLFHLTPSIINKQGKMWLSLSLLDGLADIWKIFDITSMVAGVGDGVTPDPYPIPCCSNMKQQSFM